MIRHLARHRRWLGDPRLRKGLVFLPNFALAKLAIYLTPLLIAAIAEPALYGAIEFAQSVGLLSVGLIVSAPLNGVTQRYLVGRREPFGDLVAATTALAGIACLAVAGVGWAMGLDGVAMLAMAALASAVVHNVASMVFRTLGRRNISAWGDGVAMLIAGVIVAVLLATRGRADLRDATVAYMLVTVATVVGGLVALALLRRPDLGSRLLDACRIGFPMALVGTMAIWLGVGGRVTVGLLNASALPAFGLAFRVAGLTLGLQQLSTTALFVRLYSARTRAADRLLGVIYAAVAVMAAGIAIAGRYLPDLVAIKALEGGAVDEYRRILPVTTLQVFYWIGYAMSQMRVNRSRLAARSIVPTAVVLGVGLALTFAVGWWVSNDIVVLCWLVAAHAAALFAVNMMVLAGRGLPHARIAWVGAAGGAVLTLIAVATQLAGGR